VSSFWKGFEVLYVTKDIPEQTVLEVLKAAGCKNIIAQSLQKETKATRLCPIEERTNAESYPEKRSEYFFDKQHKYRLFYIPDIYRKEVKVGLKMLVFKYTPKAGVDIQSRFPWISPTVCLLVFIFLFLRSENRWLFGIASIFPLMFSIQLPFYTNAAAVCLLLYDYYLVVRLWHRKNALHYLSTNIYVIIFFIVPLFLTFLQSYSGGFLFTGTMAASVAASSLYEEFRMSHRQQNDFMPIFIRPAQLVPVITKRTVFDMLVCAAGIALLCIELFVSASITPAAFMKGLYLPAPTRYTEYENFPTLADYIVWSWNIETYPYRSLNDKSHREEKPVEGEAVSIPRYEKIGDNIQEKNEVVFRYDTAFRKSVLRSIDGLPSSAIEKLMKKQGNNLRVDYLTREKDEPDMLTQFLLICAFFIPVILFLYYCYFGKKKYDIYF